jgi:hypothetical protein
LTRLIPLIVALVALSGFTCAQAMIIEAESYSAWHDEGGNTIGVVSCSAASGGQAVEGFDYPGDWIELVLTLGNNGSYADILRSAGVTGITSTLQSTVYGCGPSGGDLVSSFTTLGEGIY